MPTEQLERSILERKERDELHAIASAMSLKPAARSRKSDIIDLILEATGVGGDEGAGGVEGGNENGQAGPARSGGSSRGARQGLSSQTGPPSDAPATGPGRLFDELLTRPGSARSRDAASVTDAPGDPDGEVAALGGASSIGRVRRAPRVATKQAPSEGASVDGASVDGASVDGASVDGASVSAGASPPHLVGGSGKATAGLEGTEGSGDLRAEAFVVGGAQLPDSGRATDELSAKPASDLDVSPRPGDARPSGRVGSLRLGRRREAEGSGGEPSPAGLVAPDGTGALDAGDEALRADRRLASEDDLSVSDARESRSDGGTRTRADLGAPAGSTLSRQAGAGNGTGQVGNGTGQVGEASAGVIDAGNRRGRRRRGRERERPDAPVADQGAWQGELVPVRGLLDLREEGYGFLRTSGYLASSKDVYVSVSQARRFALRKGDAIEGACRPAGASEKYPALIRIDTIGGLPPEQARTRPRFEDLTPLFPDSTLRLELPGDPANMTARIVDLISPIGKGQRGMIVSPPKAGKTTIMKQIAHSIEANNPDVHLIVLLVDERPEEVTDMRRSVRGEVIASTFDRPADEHTAVAELTIERAKRLVEVGRDVVIVLDGITRLARAYNLAQPATGRIMSGGVDSGALYPPKRFFGAARNIEEGGSLTILATALVETGSKMDEVIFEEFKGTGNMELRLDRRLAERRLYPAIDVNASSTRHEELLFDRSQLQQVWKLRRVLNALGNEGNAAAGLELLIDKIRSTRSNDEFLAEIAKAPVATA